MHLPGVPSTDALMDTVTGRMKIPLTQVYQLVVRYKEQHVFKKEALIVPGTRNKTWARYLAQLEKVVTKQSGRNLCFTAEVQIK